MTRKMRFGWAALAAFALCALSAEAASVTSDEAALAARGWVLRGGTLGAVLGSSVEKVAAHATTNGATFYAVRMYGGGTVFLSGDTDLSPVICFTSDAEDFSTFDAKSPLWAMLNADLSSRSSQASAPVALASAAAASRAVALAANARRWDALIAAGAAPEAAGANLVSGEILSGGSGVYSIGDVRVPSFVQSKWDQRNVGSSLACYNYYTPNGSDPGAFVAGSSANAYCGCVATAMAQVMRYWKYPTASVAPVTRLCSWGDEETDLELTTQGGTYDWEKMTLVPGYGEPEDNRKAIGKLTSDAGITVRMNYTASGSGAIGSRAPEALREVFGYASAEFAGSNYAVDIGEAAFPRILFSNFDAGCPVLMFIYGATAGGHAVVGDGYGYKDEKAYVHLNMGWSGQKDMWYNVPDVDADWYKFTLFHGAGYNIFPDRTGSIVSGRVLDDDAAAVAGASVTVYKAGTATAVTSAVTGAAGVYGFILDAGSYDIVAKSSDGTLTSTLEDKAASGVNSWGNDIVLSKPSVRIGEELYASLDRALAEVQAGETVEILLPAKLGKSVTLAAGCTVVSTNAAASATPVTRADGAALTVADGATLVLSNVVFAASAATLVTVQAGGNVTLAAGVDLGVDSSVAAISTATATGFTLAGALTGNLLFHCDAATAEPSVFGSCACAQAVADESAVKIVCIDDGDRETRGLAEGGSLRWKVTDVPFEDSTGYFVDALGATNAYARLDRVFERYAARVGAGETIAEVVVRETGDPSLRTLSLALSVTNALTIRGETAAAEINPTATGRFTVGEGGSLVISNLVVSGYAGPRLLHVTGGNLTLAEGAVLTNIVCRAESGGDYVMSDAALGGAIALERGVLRMLSGATIVDCQAEGDGTYGVYGGGIYACGGLLSLAGGEISGCRATVRGGGVYADMSYGDLDVEIAGDLRIAGNESDASGQDNLAVLAADPVENYPTVTGVLTAADGIGVNYESGVGNEIGEAFAAFDPSLSASEVRASASAFFNDAATALGVTVDEEDRLFRWADSGGVDPSQAGALLIYGDGTDRAVTNDCEYIEDAFAGVTNAATIVVLQSDFLLVDLTVRHDVLLRTADGGQLYFFRYGDCDISLTVEKGASLTVSNLVFCGNSYEYYMGGDPVYFENPFFDVRGGSLTLGGQTAIWDFLGVDSPSASSVWVADGGTVTMEEGSQIARCCNYYDGTTDGIQKDADAGLAGAIVLAGGTAFLKGGEVTQCAAWKGGAVSVGNDSVAYVSGAFSATGSGRWKDGSEEGGVLHTRDSNFTYDGNGLIALPEEFTGSVGVSAGWNVTTDNAWSVPCGSNVFGVVTCDGPITNLSASAARFFNDGESSVTGVIVTNATQAMLVWSSAMLTDPQTGGTYYEDENGNRYGAVETPGPGPTPPGPTPEPTVTNQPTAIAFKSIERVSGTEWALVITNRVEWCNYRLLWTEDLAAGFTATGAWEQATAAGEWTTNVLFTVPAPAAVFWRAEGKEGEVPQ